MIQGEKKEVKQSFENKKYVGFFKGRVKAINPTREQLNEMFGNEDKEGDKEIEYTSTKDGVEATRVVFWIEVENKPGVFLSHSIQLKNEIRKNKDGDKIQVINSVGDTAWPEADEDGDYDEKALFDNFKHFTNVTKWVLPNGDESEKWAKGAKPAKDGVEVIAPKQYHPAVVGEADLVDFIKVWLGRLELRKNINPKNPPAILLNTKKLFAGNFKDLTSQLNGSFDDLPFVGLAFVQVDREDPDKQYQKIFRHFLPGGFMKYINNGCKMPDKYSQDVWDKFMAEVEGEYGPSGKYVLEPLKEYDPNEDVAASKQTKADKITKTNSQY